MARAAALPHLIARPLARCGRGAAFAAAILLTGCMENSIYSQMNSATPVGDPFSLSQYRDYSYLARSFGTQDAPPGEAFDAEGSISLTGADNTTSGLANAYAKKAMSAAHGDEVLPEPAPEGDADADNVRFELLRDLDEGRDKAPDDAARAQADYDCWIMDRRVPQLVAASATCRRAVTVSLAKLEREINQQPASETPPTPAPQAAEAQPAPAPTPAPDTAAAAPTPQAATTASAAPSAAQQNSQFTVLFAPRSAKLTPDQLTVVAQAITAARNGRQSHISVVGHSDNAENSRALSLRRADVVEGALIQLGARPEAITVSGVGKAEAATEADGQEAQNRRVVITLIP